VFVKCPQYSFKLEKYANVSTCRLTLSPILWPFDLRDNACRRPIMDYISTDFNHVDSSDILLIQHGQTDMQLTVLFLPAISTDTANEVQNSPVSVSACISVYHKSEFYQNGWTAFWHGNFLQLILQCVNEIQIAVSTNVMLLPFATLS